MKVEVIRQFEWVQNYCIRQGFLKSAEVAGQIDQVFYYLYGDEFTMEWYKMLRDPFYEMTGSGGISSNVCAEEVGWLVAADRELNVACRQRCECDDICWFAEFAGRCRDRGSLFSEFKHMYLKESESIR